MFPVIGSGRFITAPIITDDGEPIQDPLVLLEANPGKGLDVPAEVNGDAQNSQLSTGNMSNANGFDHSNTNTSNSLEMLMEPSLDKKIIQWKLTLHQIGWWYFLLFYGYFS